MKIGDFATISDYFDDFNKNYEKSKRILDVDGIPDCYLRTCYVLETLSNSYTKAEMKKMNPSSSKGLSILKQKLKKNNKTYVAELKTFEEVTLKIYFRNISNRKKRRQQRLQRLRQKKN